MVENEAATIKEDLRKSRGRESVRKENREAVNLVAVAVGLCGKFML